MLWDLLIGPAEEVPLLDDVDAVDAALNSPIGHLTEALLVTLGEQKPGTYEEISGDSRVRLERLLIGARPGHRYARVLLARATAWLYRLKSELIVPSFLARFEWAGSAEAREIWLGYLRSPQLTPELWLALRPHFLDVFPHSADLEASEDQFYAFFASILLKPDILFDAGDARRALQQGTPKGRSHVAWYWWRQADSAPDYGATLYRERLKYLLTTVWPLEQELREEASSGNLARLAIACRTEFRDAVVTITPLLTTVRQPHDVLWGLKEDHSDQYPEPTLTLINAIVGNSIERWDWPELRKILIRLVTAQPSLAEDPRFLRLDTLLHPFE